MEKKPNLSNVENTKSNSPSADDLKRRFKEGSIPLQTDYADLINIADIGRRAVGKAPGQTDNPNSALVLNNGSGLAVKVNSSGGLQADKNGVSVKIRNKSLLADNSGLAVNNGRGLRINNDRLEVDNHHGIEIVNEGVKVKAGNGIKVDDSGVSLNIGETKDSRYSSLRLKNNIFSVELNDGLVDKSGGITVGQGDGIIVGNQTVSVKAGDGIKVDKSGVSIDLNKVLPKGMIVMFSGSSVPTGWALCDGNSGTPNLIDRFILGGNFSGINGKSNNTVSGYKNEKSFNFYSEIASLNIQGYTSGCSLSINQIPNHNHFSGIVMDIDYASQYGNITTDWRDWAVPTAQHNDKRYIYYSSGILNSNGEIGENSPEKHNHEINLRSIGEHNHKNEITVPYYILAFIMKL
ncbi:tail fiber protein [Photorhabdus sp. CRCIA-P01]|uniref:tail fiber protein n=1 Tax=Photorhabdus sp. CRCIA-P01 TaxID=2019570 RepID=UPI000E59E51D|nr:tail fiber protein [Photorhabdus sp. CRCIA-P01]